MLSNFRELDLAIRCSARVLKFPRMLQSLNLPGSLQALEKPLGLPPTLVAHAEEIRQQEGLHRLRRTMHETSKLKANDEAVYKEGNDILQSEAAEDDRARLKYGTERWTRPPSKQAAESLYKTSTEIDGYLKSARSSDELVQAKLKEHESVLQVLSGTDRDLEEYVPSSRRTQMPPNVQKAATSLRAVLSEVSRLESSRKRKAESLREKAKQDDISKISLFPIFPSSPPLKQIAQTPSSSPKQPASSGIIQCKRSNPRNSRTYSKRASNATTQTDKRSSTKAARKASSPPNSKNPTPPSYSRAAKATSPRPKTANRPSSGSTTPTPNTKRPSPT